MLNNLFIVGFMSIHIRIANPPKEFTEKFPTEVKEFYYKYSKKVYSIVISDEIKNFIEEMLKIENIDINKIIDARIMIFPCYRSSDSTYGLVDNDSGQISIYPIFSYQNEKVIPSCLIDFTNENLNFIIITQVVHTLIHEILHLKYLDEDDIELRAERYVANLCKRLEYF